MRLIVLFLSLVLAACPGSDEPTPATSAATSAGGDHKEAPGHDHDHATDSDAVYSCPMHPEVTSEEAGQRCGKCNMFLVKPGDEDKHTGG